MRVQPFAAVFVVCLSVSFRLCFNFLLQRYTLFFNYAKEIHYLTNI